MSQNGSTDLRDKKPWEVESAYGMVIIIGLFLFLQVFLFLFNEQAFEKLLWLIFMCVFFVLGLLYFWLVYKYRVSMPRRDKIFHIIPALCVFFISAFIIWIELIVPLLPLPPGTYIYRIYFFEAEDFDQFVSFASVIGFYLSYSAVAAIVFLVSGVYLLKRNSRSPITQLFFLSLMCLGFGWLVFLVYNLIPITSSLLVSFTYICFYTLIFSGFVIFTHACQLLSAPSRPFLPRGCYLILGFSFLFTVLLILLQLDHSPWPGLTWIIIGKIRIHSFLFVCVFLLSLLFPAGYSVYRLSFYPAWLTTDRRRWIKRIRLGILLLIPYPLGEALAGLHTDHFLHVSISPSNPLPQYLAILVISTSTLYFASFVFFSSMPDATKWFFDEIKFRASPELQKLDPNVNLADIYEQVDEWQKTSILTPKEMTNQKIKEYVQRAKSLIGS